MKIDTSWLVPYFTNLQGRLAATGVTGLQIDYDKGADIQGRHTDDEYRSVFVTLAVTQQKNQIISTAIDRMIGQMILHFMAEREVTLEDAVSQLDLVEITGKSLKTLSKLPRMVAVLPDEVFKMPNLGTMHYVTVTSFSGPTDNLEEMPKFNDDRVRLLQAVSANPSDWNRIKLTAAMREIQGRYNVKARTREPVSEIIRKFIETSVAMKEWGDEQYELFGVSRVELLDRWEQYREELTERNQCPEDVMSPDKFSLPWDTGERDEAPGVIDAEIVDEIPTPSHRCPHCQSELLTSEERGVHCDGCDDFNPELDLPK